MKYSPPVSIYEAAATATGFVVLIAGVISGVPSVLLLS